MVHFIESRVTIEDKNTQIEFDKVAKRLQIPGYVLLGVEHSKLETKDTSVDLFSRLEFENETLSKIRKNLPRKRYKYDLLSVKTTDPKVAQWVVKDNRVDIVTIPLKNQKEILSHTFVNVAANSKTFIELDISQLFESFGDKNKSVFLRNLARTINILLSKNTMFLLTTNVRNPLDFRDKRAIFAIGKMLGIPEKTLKENYRLFYERLLKNRKKLSADYIANGIWKTTKDGTLQSNEKDELTDSLEALEIPLTFDDYQLNTIKLERQRYLLFEILTEEEIEISKDNFMTLYWAHFAKLFGELGSSRAGAYLMHYNPEKKIGILRCSNYALNPSRAVLTTITEYQETRLLVHILKVSGTIKNLNKIRRKKNA